MATTTPNEFILTQWMRGITIDGKWRNALRSLLNYENRHQNKGRIMVIIGLKLPQMVCLCMDSWETEPKWWKRGQFESHQGCLATTTQCCYVLGKLIRIWMKDAMSMHPGRITFRLSIFALDKCSENWWMQRPTTPPTTDYAATHQSSSAGNGMLSEHTLNDKSCWLCSMPFMPGMAATHIRMRIICLS